MKNALLLATLAVACLLPLSSSCVAPRVEKVALFEPAQLAWPEVETDYLRGIDDGVSEGDLVATAADALRAEAPKMETALEEKNTDKLRLVPWTTMKPWVSRGIDDALADGELGPTSAESARVHLQKFDDIVSRLRGGS